MGVKKFAVLGDPVDHSLSPIVHEVAYQALGLDWEYSRIQVAVHELEEFLAQNNSDYAGFSLTMPLKDRLVAIAIGQGWQIDQKARLLGNANTWFFDQKTSQISVANTDLVGALKALEDLPSSLNSVAILGSGATARTLTLATLLTFKDLSSLTVFSRRPEPAQAIAAIVSSTNRFTKFEWLPLEAAADFGGADFTVNTLPSSVASQVEIDQQFEESYVLDVTYDSEAASPAQSWPTANRVNGRTMLVHQALEQLRLFGAFRDGNQNVTAGQVATAMLEAIS